MLNASGSTHLPGRGKFRTGSGRLHRSGRLASQTQWETCEIDDAEGFRANDFLVRGHWFQACASGPNGRYTVATSPGFYCPSWAPEPEYAERHLVALTSQLIAEGWELADRRGTDWWSLRFRRRVRANVVEVPAIRDVVERVAEVLAALPSEQWAEGVRELLKVLDAECLPGCDAQGALMTIKAGIERRLDSGHW
jgi:hypothetical protein